MIDIIKTCSLFLVLASLMDSQVDGAPTVWDFDNPANRLSSTTGIATMQYRDPLGSGWGPALTQFGTASGFGLPPLPGGDADVLFFPATTPDQGYTVNHNAPSNGSQANRPGAVANYTLVYDLLWPNTSDGVWRSFYQTDPANSSDGDFFAQDEPSGGIGIGGNYLGSLTPADWHRVAFSVRAADGEGQMHKFIDGQFVGGQGTTGSGISSRWGLDSTFHLFADENGDTAAGYVSSIMFVDRQMTPDEITALGGPHADGANVPGSPAPQPRWLPRSVEHIIAHRGRSCCAPENTISAINAAFDVGATAIEVDIRTSADGVAVLMHDSTVTRTTNGTGSASAMTVSQLKQLDAGAWFDPSFAGEEVPTLAEALVAAHGRGRLLLDTKESNMGAVINQALLDATAMLGDTVDATAIWPWSGGSLTQAGDYQTNIPNVETVHGAPPSTLDQAGFDVFKALGIVGFDVGSASEAFIDAAHENDMFVTEFTVLDPDEMRALMIKGVDGMETDFPGYLSAISPVNGDVNGDTAVTVDDYVIIRDHFFEEVTDRLLGDLTTDGIVNFDDFRQWLESYPGGPDAAHLAIASLPEPSSYCLLLVMGLAVCLIRRRRRC